MLTAVWAKGLEFKPAALCCFGAVQVHIQHPEMLSETLFWNALDEIEDLDGIL